MITKPIKLTDPDKVQEIVDKYFSDRKNSEEVLILKNGDKKVYRDPPTIIGLCQYLGISHTSFDRYMDEENEQYNKQICAILRDAKDRIINELVDGVSKGYWTEKICLAMLSRYGFIGDTEADTTVKIIMQGNPEWSK